MICADFLAGANLDNGDPETLLFSMTRFFKLLAEDQRQVFLEKSLRKHHEEDSAHRHRACGWILTSYEKLRQEVLRRDSWRCQSCGAMSNLEVHHQKFRSQSGPDSEENLITLCATCHAAIHR